MSKSASLQCIHLVQESTQCQPFQNAVAILSYANEELNSVRKAGQPSYLQKLLLTKMKIKFYSSAMRTFGGDAEIMTVIEKRKT